VMQMDSAPIIVATIQLSLEKAGFGRIIGPQSSAR